jgi:hypothetical protein
VLGYGGQRLTPDSPHPTGLWRVDVEPGTSGKNDHDCGLTRAEMSLSALFVFGRAFASIRDRSCLAPGDALTSPIRSVATIPYLIGRMLPEV